VQWFVPENPLRAFISIRQCSPSIWHLQFGSHCRGGHRLENPTDQPLYLIEVQIGSYLGEDDIVRFDDRYSRK